MPHGGAARSGRATKEPGSRTSSNTTSTSSWPTPITDVYSHLLAERIAYPGTPIDAGVAEPVACSVGGRTALRAVANSQVDVSFRWW